MSDLFVLGPPVQRSRDRRPWWLPALVAAVLALVPAGYLAYRYEQLHAFRTAPVCAGAGCRSVVAATVTDVAESEDLTRSVLTVTPSPYGWIHFEESSPLLYDLSAGDAVELDVWHGQVWRVRADGVSEYTSTAVRYIALAVLAILALLAFAATSLLTGWWRRARLRTGAGYRTVAVFGYATAVLFALIAPVTLIGTNPATIWTVVWPLLIVAGVLALIAGAVSALARLVRSRRLARAPQDRPVPPQRARTVRRRRQMSPAAAAAWCTVFVLAILGGIGTCLGFYPSMLAARNAYVAAPVCPAGPGPGCRYVSTVTVRDAVDRHHGKSTDRWIDLTDGRRIQMPGSDGFIKALDPGDRITLETWRGKVTKVGDSTPTHATTHNPENNLRGLGFGLLATLALALVIAAVTRRSRDRRFAAPRPVRGRWRWYEWALLAWWIATAVLVSLHTVATVFSGAALAAVLIAYAALPPRLTSVLTLTSPDIDIVHASPLGASPQD